MQLLHGIRPYVAVDLPVCLGLTHRGITYYGGNKCFIPSVLCDAYNVEKVSFSLEAHLCQTYPQYSSFFKDYRKISVSNTSFPFRCLQQLLCFKEVSLRTAARIQISIDLLGVETDAMNRFRLFQFQLCHVNHLLFYQNRKKNSTDIPPIPHLNQYFHTGILPRIPFEYSKLFINKRNEFYGGQHITNCGMMGLIVDFFVNKVLRQTCKKRERCDIWILFFERHFNLWPFMVDIILLEIFWGVYEPKNYHPPNYIPSIEIAVALGMMARYMASFKMDEVKQWIEQNQNLMILSWCAYIYDQIDNNYIYYAILCRRFDHEEYNFKLKVALNNVRKHICEQVSDLVAAHLTPSSLQTLFVLRKWKKIFKEVDAISVAWYIDSKNPKYSPPCNIFYELYIMFKTYYCEQWNIKRKANKNENYSEKKCFIHCDPEIHHYTTILAVWTISCGSKIPLFELLYFIGLPEKFIKIIRILPFILFTHKSWKKTTIKNLHYHLVDYYNYIPYVIYYLDMCYKISYFRYTQLSQQHEREQITRMRTKACSPFSNPPSCDLLLCRFCREVKNSYSAPNESTPFGGSLAFASLPSLKPKNQRTIFHHKNEFGPFKNNNAVVNEYSEVTCGTKYFMNDIQMQNYLCQMEALRIPLGGKITRVMDNMFFTICEVCGSNFLASKHNYINDKFICDNEIRNEPSAAFSTSAFKLGKKNHYFCNAGICNNVTFSLKQILDENGNFAMISVCRFHDSHMKFNCFYSLNDICSQLKETEQRNLYYTSHKYLNKQSTIQSYGKL